MTMEAAVNKEKVSDLEITIDSNYLIEDSYIIVRRGKKKYYICP